MRAAIQSGERLAALRGQAELILPAIRKDRFAGDQAVLIEFLDDAAEVAGIKTQFGADLLCRRVFSVRKFVENPCLAQRERAFQEPLIENAELAGIEAVESTNRRYLVVVIRLCYCPPRYLALSNNYLTLTSIFAGHATMILLRNIVREERPSCRSSLASARRASGAWPPSRS